MSGLFTVKVHPLQIYPFSAKYSHGNTIEVCVSILYNGDIVSIPYHSYKGQDKTMSPEIYMSYTLFGDLPEYFLTQEILNHGDLVNYDFTRLLYKLRPNNNYARVKSNNQDVIINTAFFISLLEEMYQKNDITDNCISIKSNRGKWNDNIENSIKFFDEEFINSFDKTIIDFQNLLTFIRKSRYYEHIKLI